MPPPLPAVEVIRKSIDESFDPSIPVLWLRWADHGPAAERLWELPDGLSILGTPPRRFGMRLKRTGGDAYELRLIWEQTHLSWPLLSRAELLATSLAPLLAALGIDLWAMLEHPIGGRARPRAA